MQAVIVKKYGGPEVAVVAEVPKPTITKPNQILIKVMASSVNSGDARIRRADPWFVRLAFGFTGPRQQVLGMAFAGVIEVVGTAVTSYQVGDRVYGMSEKFMGAHAEHLLVPETTPMGHMPAAMSFTDAAALPFGGTTALHFLAGLDLQGKSVFINGASGAVGVCFIQIAKARGGIVTAVTSTDNIELMQSLGAAMVLNYTKIDILSLNTEYDVVIDCVNKIPMPVIDRLVKKGGVIVPLAGLIKEMFQSRKVKKAKVRIGPAKVLSNHFDEISDLYLTGKLRPIIDSTYPLSGIVAAYTQVDSNRKVGNVVLKVSTEI